MNIKAIRKAMGLTQEDVAERAHITQANYSYIENGKCNPSVTTIKRIAMVFNCTVDELLDDSADT